MNSRGLIKSLVTNFHWENYSYFKTSIVNLLLMLVLSSCSFIDDILDIDPGIGTELGTAPDKLRFVAIGDVGKGNSGQFKVAQAIKEKCQTDGCDFVLLLGDNIYSSGVDSLDDEQFQAKFEEPYKDLNMPFYAVLGNHDYGGSGAGHEVGKSIHQIRYTEVSSKWRMPRHYYRFQVQNTMFYAMDTNAQFYKLAKDQKKDISRWLSDANSKWKIAFGHHPYKSNGRHGNAGNYDGVSGMPIASGVEVKKFAESVWCGKVDLYLSGHDHNRQWLSDKCDGTALAVSGAGATTTPLQGSNPSLFEAETIGLIYISIDGNTLTAEFIDADGNTEFTHIIEKTE